MRYLLTLAGLALAVSAAPAQFHPEAHRAHEEHWRAHPEHPDRLVNVWHERFFHRVPPGPWVTHWVEELNHGVAPLVVAHILASPEYYAQCGTLEVFVRRMFAEVVGRAPTPQEYEFWLRRFYHEDRAAVAYALVTRYPPAWIQEPVVETYEYRAPVVHYYR